MVILVAVHCPSLLSCKEGKKGKVQRASEDEKFQINKRGKGCSAEQTPISLFLTDALWTMLTSCLREGPRKTFFLGKSPKLWVAGGQES